MTDTIGSTTSTVVMADELPEVKFKIFSGLLKAFDGDDGVPHVNGIASSTTRDHHGDIMEETALRDMEAAANDNMTIFLNHSYEVPEDVAGSVKRAQVIQRGYDSDGNPNWDLDMDIAVNNENERAVKSWRAIKNGTKLGLSIGAMIPKGGATRDKSTGALTISRVNLLETSIVSLPANPRSWISNAVKALNTAIDVPIPSTDYTTYTTSGNSITWGNGTGDVYIPSTTATPNIVWRDSTQPDVAAEVEEVEVPRPLNDEAVSQEAPESEPDTEDGAESEPVTESDDLEGLDAVAKAGVKSVLALLETTTAKLVDAREQAASEKSAREQAEAQRDEAVQVANEAFAQARAVFERLADTRIGRKTAFVSTQDEFAHLDGIYSEKFRRLLKQGG